MVTTNHSSYGAVLRPRITIKTIDGSQTLFTWDGFLAPEANPFVVTYVEMDNAVGEAGTFVIRINDNQNLLAKEQLRNCKVYIELGKSQSTFKFFMIGPADTFLVDRLMTAYQEYDIRGFGSIVWASRMFIHRREASDIQNIDSSKVKGDAKFQAYRLATSAVSERLWRPLKKQDIAIKDYVGWLTTGISSKVNTNIPVVNAPFTYLWDFMDQICSITGAVWFIDYSAGTEVFTLTYNPDLHTGVTIKSGDLAVKTSDDADTTSYIKQAFSVEDSSTSDAGVATRVYTATIMDATTVSSQFTNKGFNTLNNQALCQQIIIDSDARRLDTLEFVLSKVGEPDSPLSRVNGDIVLDKNNTPTGTILDRFQIPLSSIEDSAETIFVNDINVKESLLEGGQKKIWLRLFQRSGTEETATAASEHLGNPFNDPANTIKWHHNGVFDTVGPTYSGSAPGGDADKRDSLQWDVTNEGPTYCYGILSDIRRLQSRTNISAVNTLGMREVFIPTEFITNPKVIGQYLSLQLSQMSKPRRSILDFQATVPNNFLFRPYQWVSFVDGLSGVAQDLQVKRVRYIVSSQPGDPQIGALHAFLTLGGLYNSIIGSCSCV